MHPTRGELHCDHLFGALLNPQVQLAPREPAADVMLAHVLSPRAVDPQSRNINDHMVTRRGWLTQGTLTMDQVFILTQTGASGPLQVIRVLP